MFLPRVYDIAIANIPFGGCLRPTPLINGSLLAISSATRKTTAWKQSS
jgi:hypothetical protein